VHILLGILIVGVILYLLYARSAPPTASTADSPVASNERGFAFLSNGQLFFRERGGEVQALASAYVQEAQERRERTRERHGWKEGTSFNVAASGGRRSFEQADVPMRTTSALFAPGGDLLYFIHDDSIGGLFRREAGSGREMRILLKQGLHLGDLAISPDGSRIAACTAQPDGVTNIVLFDSDGSKLREATGGDTIDSAPAWIPEAPQRLLFQSAGLARDEQGYLVAQGHASIQMLNMETGSVSTVLENPAFDFLKPRVAPSGNLLFIRRPFAPPRYDAPNLLLDTLLFPFRLLRALFHYLNFFSLMYTRKPLTSASGPAVQADIKNILLQGKRIDAEKALRNERPVHGVPSLVPSTWELVSRDRDGQERILANNVVSYDISPDGSIVYSNGRGIFVLEADGKPGLALRDHLIADVFAASA
jgi:hypothetical protein